MNRTQLEHIIRAASQISDASEIVVIGSQAIHARTMKLIPLNPETEAIARRVVWFEPPAEALEGPIRFMAYATRHATHEDMKALRRYVSNEDFREALDKAPPGIIDPRSWAYWNSLMGRYPPPGPEASWGRLRIRKSRLPDLKEILTFIE